MVIHQKKKSSTKNHMTCGCCSTSNNSCSSSNKSKKKKAAKHSNACDRRTHRDWFGSAVVAVALLMTLLQLIEYGLKYFDMTTTLPPIKLPSMFQSKESANIKLSKVIQPSHGTSMDRYPDEYSWIKHYFHDTHPNPPPTKILSFGCSTGDEPITLASQYFTDPSLKVYGVDVDHKALTRAQEKVESAGLTERITLFHGKETSPNQHGPFDAIFANSVFYVSGDKDVNFVTNAFPFQTFETNVEGLDSFLRVGGLLGIQNSNYAFADTKVFKEKYEFLPMGKCKNHVVSRIDKGSGKYRAMDRLAVQCVFKKVR